MSILICLIVGALGGASFGYFGLPAQIEGAAAKAEWQAEEKNSEYKAEHGDEKYAAVEAADGRFPPDAIEIPLQPIITTMGTDKKTKVRIELSIVAVHGTPQESALKSEVREDVIAYLWGTKVEDLEGGRGFRNLRNELDERARTRGRGAILGLLIGGLVIQ